MGVLVTYRNAFMYYAFMPGLWFSAILIFLGMTEVYLYYLPIKMTVIIAAHSETKWDRFLYKYKILHPLAWIVERTISTPSTHYAHHGLTSEDEISNAVYFKWKGEEAVKTNRYLYSEWKDDKGQIIGRMLFDHDVDPDENNNLAYLDNYKSVVNELSNLLGKKKNELD